MFRIAVVDDVRQDAETLRQLLSRYQEERGIPLEVTWYPSAEAFLEQYQRQHDLIFMDIRMGGMDGMTAARHLREKDDTVLLIFLTSLARYAVQGYEVDALDFIVKPVTYPALELKLRRALARRQKEEEAPELLIKVGAQQRRLKEAELIWVEVFEHNLQYRTVHETIPSYGTLKDVEKTLPAASFVRVNNQTIINLRYVERIEGSKVHLQGRDFDISRMRKKDFLAAFHAYMARD